MLGSYDAGGVVYGGCGRAGGYWAGRILGVGVFDHSAILDGRLF